MILHQVRPPQGYQQPPGRTPVLKPSSNSNLTIASITGFAMTPYGTYFNAVLLFPMFFLCLLDFCSTDYAHQYLIQVQLNLVFYFPYFCINFLVTIPMQNIVFNCTLIFLFFRSICTTTTSVLHSTNRLSDSINSLASSRKSTPPRERTQQIL